MRAKRSSRAILSAATALCMVARTPAETGTPAGQTLRIVHFSVGNGDATLVVDSTSTADVPRRMLIDGGNRTMAGTVVMLGLRQEKVDQLDYALATHHDQNHSDGLKRIIEMLPMSGLGGIWDRDRAWPADLKPLRPGNQLPFGDIKVKCVAVNGQTESWANPTPPSDENSQSVALKVLFRNFSYFIGGDLTGGGMNAWFRATIDMESHVVREMSEVDVLRVNHHGSLSSSNPAFLNALNPVVAIISADQNSVGYMLSAEVLDRLLKLPRLRAIYITGNTDLTNTLSAGDKKKVNAGQGNLTISTDGNGTFQVNGTTFPLGK